MAAAIRTVPRTSRGRSPEQGPPLEQGEIITGVRVRAGKELPAVRGTRLPVAGGPFRAKDPVSVTRDDSKRTPTMKPRSESVRYRTGRSQVTSEVAAKIPARIPSGGA